MKKITFKYADAMSDLEWRTQHCTVESIEECIKIYGLDESDVEYSIIDIQEEN